METFRFKQSHGVARGIFLLAFALMCRMSVSAQTSFTVGKLMYTTTSSSTVSVVSSIRGGFTGNLVISASVKDIYGTQYTVTSIGDRAFSLCTGLTSVTISNSVKSIGESAFYGCTALTSFTIPSSVTSIGRSAFYGCTGLTSVTIGNSVTSIGSLAFRDCTSLKSVTIGNSVKSIGSGAFGNCPQLKSITIPKSVKSIGDDAFSTGGGLTKINIDENNTAYSSIDGVLFNKSQTELIRYPGGKQGEYTIPNSVTSIKKSAFSVCRGLTSVIIPSSVTSIGDYAFGYCNKLTDIYCYIVEPLTIVSSVFYDVPKNTCKLHVPIGSKKKYKAANVWKEFLNIVEFDATGIVSIDNSPSTTGNDVWFTLSGVRLNGKPTKAGVYIVNGKKVVIK